MDGVTASAYTDVNKPVGVELLWPARNPAAEAYVFAFVLNKFQTEEDALTHVRLGGYVQTVPKPLSAFAYQSLQKQFRMVKDRCLNCGLPGHKAGWEHCKAKCAKVIALSTSATQS